MYFKKLEIFGFKSFADKTVLNFGPGITAVIGPNGCGKSNIFDSIRWVLGEQSVKELRGSSMEDVIFNGTDKKPGLGFAEVSLTFSNESKMLPVDYNEVTVTRRLFRSGESEYLLNRLGVRLKDIQELFMGTGIGAEAYSLVQQGKVDLVVSARPEDRRLIFDEAAGITKYKSKKKEALNKLKETENNLLRINDIVVEVKRQIASIERQASKARRYKEEFEKLKSLEVQLGRMQWHHFQEQRRQLQTQVAELRQKENRHHAEIEEYQNLLSHEEALLADLEQKISDIHAAEIKMENQMDIEQRQIGFNDERWENLSLNESRLQQHKTQLVERCRQQQEKIDELNKAIVALTQSWDKNRQELDAKKTALEEIARRVSECKEIIRREEEKILDLNTRQVRVKNELTEIMKELQGILARKRRLEMEGTKVSSEKQEVDQKLQSVGQAIEAAQQRLNELKSKEAAKQESLTVLKERLTALQHTISELDKKRLLFISQKEFIEKLRVQYEDIPDPVVEGRILTQIWPTENHNGIIGKVKRVNPLSQEEQSQLKHRWAISNPDPLYEIICETKFIELDPQDISAKIGEITLQIETECKAREETIERMSAEQTELDRLLEEFRAQEKSLSIFESQKSEILKSVNKLISELELVDLEIKESVQLLKSLKEREDTLSAELNTSNQQIQTSQQNIKDQQNATEAQSRERESVTVTIAQLETEIDSFKNQEKNQQESLTIVLDTQQGSQEEIERIDAEIAESTQKKTKLQEESELLKLKIEDLKTQKDSLKESLRGYEAQRGDISQRLNSIHRQISAVESAIENFRGELHQYELKEQELTFSERGLKDKLLQTYKINLDDLFVAGSKDVTDVADSPVPSHQTPLAEGSAASTESLNLFFNPEELLVEIDRLKKRCDSFGSVNLVAIDEFEELRQRFEFLTKQQSDLITAKESLHQTILKINRTTRQMFMETFTKVSEEFRIYFRMLFGGGEAQLVLLDPENVLESGIEIVARPPGKKLQNISLLSGGEKTLTAIALVFGVFKVRPSPFCVLDEIDAALDESNVGRFGYLLRDFAKIAQFIVITHNKRTITHADVMYGITMQETGVSKIVSVKFSADAKKKDATQEIEVGV